MTVQAPESTAGHFTADFVLSFEGQARACAPFGRVGVCLAPEPIHIPSSDAGVDDAGMSDAGTGVLCLSDADCGGGTCIFGEVCINDALCSLESLEFCDCFGLCYEFPDDGDAGVSDGGAFDDGGAEDFIDGGFLSDDAGGCGACL